MIEALRMTCKRGIVAMSIHSRKPFLVFSGFVTIAALIGAFAWTSYGQFGYSRYKSPPENVATTIAGRKISVDYYAPSMHGRKVMGGLVPFGHVWCTGANWATKITTEANLRIGDLKLPAGSYSIWTLPNLNEWTLIINKQTGQFHLDYDASLDFGRTKMNLNTLTAPVETFKIELRSDGGNKGTLALLWETTEASIPFSVSP
ncbi:MAG: DUF2911 domain-containing protein [Candidatus Acidiferrales bacterium]|jgi:hypothetical protein